MPFEFWVIGGERYGLAVELQNVQVCDATNDEKESEAGDIIINTCWSAESEIGKPIIFEL